MTYPDLHQALLVLGLGERATLREIKDRHKALVKIHHPDSGNSGDPEIIRKVNAAYRLLLDYVSAYHFCFTEDEFYEQCPEEHLRRQFMDDPF
ncbi:MAG TPA: J domain-containing protein [Desulfuromonadaceae bacterium]|jgi:DnaJ-class molecular chaperone